MSFNLFFKRADPTPLLSFRRHNDKSFYPAFLNDLSKCRREEVIESPFITRKRMEKEYTPCLLIVRP